ncbi:BrnT family toxin [Amygdalobacter nucleatus]|nr:BrnT family toxin [Amygdalobacter nucleatus]
MLVFEWDENKNKLNQKKHGISFDEARTVFYDEAAIVFDNP